MSTTMRAKLRVSSVTKHEGGSETVKMHAVAKNTAYPEDGSDEDNTFARFSPSADFSIHIANPALYDKFAVGDKFYADFTPAP